jgi:hypothetical protein
MPHACCRVVSNGCCEVSRKLEDRPGDHFVREVGSAVNGRSGGFECDAHETGGLRIEGLAV